MKTYIEKTKERIFRTCKINENGCWIWQGYKCAPRNQYGLTSLAINGPKKKCLSHRAAYILWKGVIPCDFFVLHSCDIPLCCNPAHLHLGTPQDNMDQMRQRGRKKPALGIKNRHAKLNDEIILKIRKLYSQGLNQSRLRKIFNLASSTISYIINRKTWRHI